MNDVGTSLKQWNLDDRAVRDRVYRAATPRERERWHAVWLVSRGWSQARVAQELERDPETIGEWLRALQVDGPTGMAFEQSGGPPPSSTPQPKRR